jgi:bisphosphoglycerate-independent phosphoglycerate mutase (AlkP superfamily)
MRITLSVYNDESQKIELDLNDIDSIERIHPSNDADSVWDRSAKGYTVITLKEGKKTSQGASVAFVAEDPSEIMWERAHIWNAPRQLPKLVQQAAMCF